MCAQSTDISHIFKESSHKCLLTLCAHLSPLTSQILALTEYNTSLHAKPENSSRDTISSI